MPDVNRHEHEKEQLRELFSQQHIDRFDDRFAIMEEFFNHEEHLSTAELADALRAKGHDFSFEFVRDTMALLEKLGFAESKMFAAEVPEPLHSHLPGHHHHHARQVHTKRWEHRHLGTHHDHMVCTKCNKIIEFNSPQLEEMQEKVADDNKFHMLQHKMTIYGLCDDCFKARALNPALTEIKPGEKVVITGFDGPNQAKLRLARMGFCRGAELEVVSSSSQNVVVISQLQRFVVDYELASFIRVAPVNRRAA